MSLYQGTAEGFTKQKDKLERQAVKGCRPDRPTTLRLQDIATCPAVFQPRQGDDPDGAHYRNHVRDLVHQLDTMPRGAKVLEPIVVYAVGRSFYALDGHHRRAAYETAGITEGIPVLHYEGSLEDAIHEACRLNSRVHLNFDRSERNEVAWRLVCVGETMKPRTTVDRIVGGSGLSRRAVEKMRTLYRRLQARFGSTDEFTGDHVPAVFDCYRAALEADRGEKREFTEEMREAMIVGMVDNLGKALGKHPHKHTDVMGEALHRYLGKDRFREMAEFLGFVQVDPEELEEFRASRDQRWMTPHLLQPARCGVGASGEAP